MNPGVTQVGLTIENLKTQFWGSFKLVIPSPFISADCLKRWGKRKPLDGAVYKCVYASHFRNGNLSKLNDCTTFTGHHFGYN